MQPNGGVPSDPAPQIKSRHIHIHPLTTSERGSAHSHLRTEGDGQRVHP